VTFAIPAEVLEDVLAHGREGGEMEVCGLFAGRRLPDGTVEVARHFRVTNAHPNPRTEYLVEPGEHLKLTLLVEDELGLEIVGFYHSHPRGPARLSTTDAARANWPGAVYFLAWYGESEGWGAWRWDDGRGRFVPEAVEIRGSGKS